jgi:GDP-mannose 6-dehydrogenase
MRIAIYGLGYVGLTGAICLASEGHEVVGVDVSEDKVRRIMAGSSPIKEPGLDKMLADALRRDVCAATGTAIQRALSRSRSCVGTPSARMAA